MRMRPAPVTTPRGRCAITTIVCRPGWAALGHPVSRVWAVYWQRTQSKSQTVEIEIERNVLKLKVFSKPNHHSIMLNFSRARANHTTIRRRSASTPCTVVLTGWRAALLGSRQPEWVPRGSAGFDPKQSLVVAAQPTEIGRKRSGRFRARERGKPPLIYLAIG